MENDSVLQGFVDETIARARALAASHPQYNFMTIMKALKVRGPVAIARTTKRKANPWNEAQRALKASRPAEMAGQSFDETSKKMVPNAAYVPWVKQAYSDAAKRAEFAKAADEREALDLENSVDKSLKLQKNGIRSLIKQAASLREYGVHAVLLAVGDKDPNAHLFTSKGYGEKYYRLIAQGGPPRNAAEFCTFVFGSNVLVEADEAEQNEITTATRADGSMLLPALRKKIRELMLERLSKC